MDNNHFRVNDIDSSSEATTVVLLFYCAGLTWLFAFFAVDQAALPFQVLFCIFNSLQGFLIFVFLIVRDKSIRDAWKKLLCRCFRKQTLDDRVADHRQKSGDDTQNTNEISSSRNSVVVSNTSFRASSHNDRHQKTTDSGVKRNRQSTLADDRRDDISVYNESPADVYICRSNSIYQQ